MSITHNYFLLGLFNLITPISGLYWIICLSTFLIADFFKIPKIIFSLHHVLHNKPLVPMLLWYTYSVPYIITSSPTEVLCSSLIKQYQICTLSVLNNFNWSLAHMNHPLLLRCLLTPSPAEMFSHYFLIIKFSLNSYCTPLYIPLLFLN